MYKKALEEWSNRIEEETPKQILDLWIKEREWDKKESIQKLIAMAGCYKTMQEFLTALIFGVESDLKRSGNSVYIPDVALTSNSIKNSSLPETTYGIPSFCRQYSNCFACLFVRYKMQISEKPTEVESAFGVEAV